MERKNIVDTMGADEPFIAGFLVVQIKGASLDSALVNGAGSAPKKCECQDGFGYPHPGKIYIVPQVEMIKNWS